MRQLEVHPQVYEELEEARFWYENRLAGLGTKFLDQVDLAMTVIKKSPEVWPLHFHGTRRYLVHRFPFAILYRYDESQIQIIAVMHQRRRPNYWKDRRFD